jgi:hypothetical protein
MSRSSFRAAWLLLCLLSPTVCAGEEFGFNLAEFEKKELEWGGYLELKGEHLELHENSALGILRFYRDRPSTLDRFSTTLQLDGSFSRGAATLNWVLQGSAAQDDADWEDTAEVFEGYASLKASPHATFDLGKKVFKWGKGYAWNPAGFIDRAKDPDDPEQALEGFIGAGADLIKSFAGPLRNLAFTAVILPVWRGINEDFGDRDQVNLAAKLYLLYRDTDLDFIWYTGNSRSSRYGFDFSRNLATNLEIHGEVAHIPKQPKNILQPDNRVELREVTDTSYLLGVRYLGENDLTTIIEYYHNDDGYSEEELGRFYALVAEGYSRFLSSGSTTLLDQAAGLSQLYGRPQAGRNYLYARAVQKEPFDLLYFAPAITAIVNLDDRSFSVSPEAVYTGFTNWEMRLRFSLINGGYHTEHAEKQNSSRLELRLRYFF